MAKKKKKPAAPRAPGPNPWPAKLRAIREKLGTGGKRLSQTAAAARVKVSRRSWAAWESGEQIPSAPLQYLIQLLEDQKI